MDQKPVISRYPVILLGVFLLLISPLYLSAQDADSSKVVIGSASDLDTLRADTSKIVEDAATDIGQNRGLFILAPDGKMQLRILGSVRFLLVYDDRNLESKNYLNTFDIATSDAERLPNYYNGLNQSRLGFEVTRWTGKGSLFIRLETDFAGTNGFRIRHAYGQYNKWLLGQTWSLFSQITTLPATVGAGGPTGGISVRSPQIRYTAQHLLPKATVSFGMEYFKPELTIPDSGFIESFQLIPDITSRFERQFDWGSMYLSAIVPILTGRTDAGKYVLRPGWGLAFSAKLNSWKRGTWYAQASGGRAITRYYKDLSGQGMDLVYDPETNQAKFPFAFGTYLTYEHHWTDKVYSNLTYSLLLLQIEDFTPDDTYHRGEKLQVNTFWTIMDGARAGFAYILGSREDQGGNKGYASRVSVLFYYDF